jgi:hypothetical protein
MRTPSSLKPRLSSRRDRLLNANADVAKVERWLHAGPRKFLGFRSPKGQQEISFMDCSDGQPRATPRHDLDRNSLAVEWRLIPTS